MVGSAEHSPEVSCGQHVGKVVAYQLSAPTRPALILQLEFFHMRYP